MKPAVPAGKTAVHFPKTPLTFEPFPNPCYNIFINNPQPLTIINQEAAT